MDNLHGGLHEIVDHRDEVDFAVGNTNVRRLAAKATIEPTSAGEGWYHDAAIQAATAAAIEARSNPYHR